VKGPPGERRHGELDAFGTLLRQLLAEAAEQEHDHRTDDQRAADDEDGRGSCDAGKATGAEQTAEPAGRS